MKKLNLLIVLVVLIVAVICARWILSTPNNVVPHPSESGMRLLPPQVPGKADGIQPLGVASNHSFVAQQSDSNSNAQSAPVHPNSANRAHDAQFIWNGPALSAHVESALGIRKAQNQEERWSAIHGLGKTLPPHEVDALIRFLEDKTVGGPGEDIRGIKNDILEALIDQAAQPARVQEVILSMFRDKSHEEWWRNFCVQHFELLYRRKWAGGSAVSGEPARSEMADAYREALAETGNSIAGTALLGIARLSEDYPEFEKNAVTKTAVQIAGDEHADPSSRIAALQVAGGLGGVEVLPIARSVATSGSSVALRMAAVSALSEVGTQEDLPVLSRISMADEAYLAKAASSALHRIESRKASGKK